MAQIDIEKAVPLLRKEFNRGSAPIKGLLEIKNKTPYTNLVGTILSSRTKDGVTTAALERLLALADTPQEMSEISVKRIAKLISPVGFYRTKAKALKNGAFQLLKDYEGEVPSTLEELTTLPGVGRKTANIVLTESFNIPSISVDTHVHRLSNRWGYVKTKRPEQTEKALVEKLPKKYWHEYNQLLVAYGQTICVPTSPFCSRCVLSSMCPKIGVTASR